MPSRSGTRRIRIPIALTAALILTGMWLGSAIAAEPASLRITTPGGEETRALAAGSTVTAVMQGDGTATAALATFTREASADERVIIELVGTPLVRRAGARGRASRADRDAVAAEHQRVRNEIARLTGRAAGGVVTREYALVFN